MLQPAVRTYFLEKNAYIHDSRSPELLSSVGCVAVAGGGVQGSSKNMDWIFINVGFLCMNKRNGFDNEALTGLSILSYTVK